MKNKRLKVVFILAVAIVLSLLLITNVHALTWDSDTKTVTISCGEDLSPYVEVDDWIDTTGRAQSMNQYQIISNTGTSIFTGWNQPMANNNNSYYGRMNVSTSAIGQQVLTIRFVPNGGTAVETTITVECTGTDNLKTVIEALGGSMPDSHTLNTDDVYTSLDGLTGNDYEAILDAETAYNALGDAEKAIVDALLSDKLGMTAQEVFDYADTAIETLANNFVDSTRLNEDVEDLEEARDILENATTLGDEFEALSPRTKERVLAKLSDPDHQFSNWDEVKEVCEDEIDLIDAQLFIINNIEYTDGVLNEEKVIAAEEEWNNSNDHVKELINQILSTTEGIEKTYPELLVRAKANKFLNDNLTKDGKHILEANNSNYKQILDAKDDYDALPDEVKDEVNKILTEEGNTTYPELLYYAQALEPTPKTGDNIIFIISALIVSSLGITATYIKRK